MNQLTKGFIAVTVSLFIAMTVPSVALDAIGLHPLAGIGLLAALCGFLVVMESNWRVAAWITLPLAVASALGVVCSGSPWLAAILMAVVAGARGWAASYGLNNALTTVPIAVAFIVSEPPTATTQWSMWLLVGLGTLVCTVWAILVAILSGKWLPKFPKSTALSRSRSASYAVILGLLVGAAAWFVVAFNWGHTGGWLMLTILIVFLPYVQDSFRKALQRAAGTIAGFFIAYAIALLTHSTPILSILGLVAIVAAGYMIATGKPYWVFAMLLTTAIVLLEGSTTNVFETDMKRLVATLIGVAIALAATELLKPFAKREADKAGVTHY